MLTLPATQVLPDFPTYKKSKFLTEEERILACNRLAIQGIGLTQGAHERIGEWTAFKMVCRDWRTWYEHHSTDAVMLFATIHFEADAWALALIEELG